MKPRIEAIIFNHDPTSSSDSSLNIRRNETAVLFGAEWQASVSTTHEDSLAAYSIQDTTGKTIKIKVKIVDEDGGNGKIRVRALIDASSPSNVLGKVNAKRIEVTAGESELEEFKLSDVRLADAGVGIHDISWRWQFRLTSTGSWTDFEVTKHRIYSVLAEPTAPWKQKPFNASNTQVPWVDVLEHACSWASGAKDVDQAAIQITREVNNLGSDLLYDSSSFYVTWIFLYFNCTRFLERLAGGVGNGNRVNCTDCAAFVTTFANAVGCALAESTMSEFESNPIMRIGETVWFNGTVGFHEVGWTGACGDNDFVFDACYKLDGEGDPATPPREPMLAANMLFGGPSDYRFRLMAASTGRLGGQANPGEKQHRPVASSDTLEPTPFVSMSLLRAGRERIQPSTWFQDSDVEGEWSDMKPAPESLPDWRIEHKDKARNKDVRLTELTFGSKADLHQTLVRIDHYECRTTDVARDVLLKILVGFSLPILIPTNDFGEVGYKDEAGFVAVFARRKVIYTLRNAGRRSVQLLQLASLLDHLILEQASPLDTKDQPNSEKEG